jgi:hypothetical protein
MKIEVIRKWYYPDCTMGELYIDEIHECYTLEPPTMPAPVKPRAIPEGTYPLTIRYSPRHGRNVPHVENVPDFQDIEIHPGNYPHDTEGCLLVGEDKDISAVYGSGDAFNILYGKIKIASVGSKLKIVYLDHAES